MERKLVVVMDYGRLPELGGISGPILSPTNMTLHAIKAMVSHGKTVLECDPRDPKNVDKRIRLNIANVITQNFGREEALIREELKRLEKAVEQIDSGEKKESDFRPIESSIEEPGNVDTEEPKVEQDVKEEDIPTSYEQTEDSEEPGNVDTEESEQKDTATDNNSKSNPAMTVPVKQQDQKSHKNKKESQIIERRVEY